MNIGNNLIRTLQVQQTRKFIPQNQNVEQYSEDALLLMGFKKSDIEKYFYEHPYYDEPNSEPHMHRATAYSLKEGIVIDGKEIKTAQELLNALYNISVNEENDVIPEEQKTEQYSEDALLLMGFERSDIEKYFYEHPYYDEPNSEPHMHRATAYSLNEGIVINGKEIKTVQELLAALYTRPISKGSELTKDKIAGNLNTIDISYLNVQNAILLANKGVNINT